MNRRQRQMLRDIEDLGFEILASRRRKHTTYLLRNERGATGRIVMPTSPSDNHHGRLNTLAHLRGLAKREPVT